MTTPTYLSLFSGIGGLDLGLDRAGWRCVGQVESDPFCRAVLNNHWPEVPKHDDVRTAVAWWRSIGGGAVDAVAGGFPCQPVSLAGRGLAQADDRWLWPAAAAVVRDLQPSWVLLENVPGLLGRGMGDVLGDLAACGYDAEWDCVPAATVGAPHLRDRVFIVAYPGREAGRPEAGASVASAGGGTVRERPPEPGGRGRAVADAENQRQQLRQTEGQRPRRPTSSGPALGDTDGQRRNQRAGLRQDQPSESRPPSVFLAAPAHSGWWATEPDVGRVAHGVPARVDRLRALGNAVVPQVAEHIGRLILAGAR